MEGASVPFLVWTDHKNLQYIRTAKRSAGYSFFQLYPRPLPPSFPPTCMFTSLTWETEEKVRLATQGQTDPNACSHTIFMYPQR